MTSVALVAVAAALLAWPAQRLAGWRRLRELANASRLAGVADPGPRRQWRLRVPSRRWTAGVALLLGALTAMWRGPAIGVAAAAALAVCLSGIGGALRRRDARDRDRDLSAALRMLRAELDVGSSGPAALTAAAAAAGAHRAAFEACARALVEGSDVVAAVSAAGGSRELIVIAAVWQLSSTLGVPVAAALARVDEDVQARRALRRSVDAVLAGPRSSAALLAGLPLLGVVLGMAMGAHPLSVLFASSAGRALLCVGVLFDAAGVAWTARLITSAERS